MAIDFKTFTEDVQYVIENRFPILLRGRHGIGKSQLVYQLAERLGLPVVERRASQMTEGDLLGLPEKSEGKTVWLEPDWLKFACENACVLFLDEVDRATLEVKQGIFELNDSRKINGNYLHKDTIVFAAVNGGEHGSQYQVSDMDPAEQDRYTCFDLDPSVEDFLDWGKLLNKKTGDVNIHPIVWDFLNQNRQHLEHKEDFEPNRIYPSRRSWHRFSDTLVSSGLLDKGASPTIYRLGTAFVGREAGVAFNDFVLNYDRQITVEDLVEGKVTKSLIKKMDINSHNTLIEKFEHSDYGMGVPLTVQHVQNICEYFVNIPGEPARKLWETFSRKDENGKAKHKYPLMAHTTKTSKGLAGEWIIKITSGEDVNLL